MSPEDRQGFDRLLGRLHRALVAADEASFAATVDRARSADDAELRRYLTSTTIWGDADSVVGSAGFAAGRRKRLAIRGTLVELAGALADRFPDDPIARTVFERID